MGIKSVSSAACFDVTTFGAVADGETDCTAAFQKAITAAATSFQNPDGYMSAVGPHAVVQVPAGRSTYRVTSMLRVPHGVDIVGDGFASKVWLDATNYYPLFVFGLDDPQVTAADRPDLFGILDTTIAPRAGVIWGFTTINGKMQQVDHGFNLGHLTSPTQPTYWEDTSILTIDACLIRNGTWGRAAALIGQGGKDGWTRPWMINTDYDSDGVLRVEFATDLCGSEDATNDVVLMINVPDATTIRLTIQLNLVLGRAAVYVNGVQVAFSGTIPSGRHLRMNEDWPFMVGAWGPNASYQAPSVLTPLTLCGLRLDAAERYVVGTPGTPQQRIDGLPLTDYYRYGENLSPSMIGRLNFNSNPTLPWIDAIPAAGYPATAALILAMNQRGGYPNRISNLSLNSGGACILLGAVLDMRIKGIRANSGVAPAIASVPSIISYPVYISECLLGGEWCVQLWECIATLERCHFMGYYRGVVQTRGCGVVVTDAMVNSPGPNARLAFSFLPWQIGSESIRVENVVIDSENSGFRDCVFEAWSQWDDPIHVRLTDISVAIAGRSQAVPILSLLGWPAATTGRTETNFIVGGSNSSGVVSLVPPWTATVDGVAVT